MTRSGEERASCPACGAEVVLRIDSALVDTASITACAACGAREFFIRKDFPQRLGLILVVLFAVIATIFYYFGNVPAAFLTLLALVVIDAIIYLVVGRVTVCYRCRAEYRGFAYNPAHTGFDLATSEKYD